MTRAVVLAYHNVGARCLSTLLAHGITIPLLFTHRDNPAENIWFDSVADLAARYDIPTITPDDPNTPEVMAQIAAAQPDFLFSFYSRHMLSPELLALARRGAYNLHGSLLPKYRGRVPVNWAVLHGERETGATLHEMVAKPDAGCIVAQFRVPILPDDTAFEVFNKLTVAAEITLDGALPSLIAGAAPHCAQDLTQGRGTFCPGGLHWAQEYLIFLRCSSVTATTGISLKGSLSSVIISRTFTGQTLTQSPHPVHLSVSMVIKKSPEASLYP